MLVVKTRKEGRCRTHIAHPEEYGSSIIARDVFDKSSVLSRMIMPIRARPPHYLSENIVGALKL